MAQNDNRNTNGQQQPRGQQPPQGGTTTAERPKIDPAINRSLHDRLHRVRAKGSLKPGESLADLCVYRNITEQVQVLRDDFGEKVTLQPKGYTDASVRRVLETKDIHEAEDFLGGTVILLRRTAQPLIARGVLEEIELVDPASEAESAALGDILVAK